MNKEQLKKETIVLLAADIYQDVYNYVGCWGDAVETIVSLAEEFEKELNWQEGDERDYIEELEKFEAKVIRERFSLHQH